MGYIEQWPFHCYSFHHNLPNSPQQAIIVPIQSTAIVHEQQPTGDKQRLRVNKTRTPSNLDLCLFNHWDTTSSSKLMFELNLWSSALVSPEREREFQREDTRKEGKQIRSRHGPPQMYHKRGHQGQLDSQILAQFLTDLSLFEHQRNFKK